MGKTPPKPTAKQHEALRSPATPRQEGQAASLEGDLACTRRGCWTRARQWAHRGQLLSAQHRQHRSAWPQVHTPGPGHHVLARRGQHCFQPSTGKSLEQWPRLYQAPGHGLLHITLREDTKAPTQASRGHKVGQGPCLSATKGSENQQGEGRDSGELPARPRKQSVALLQDTESPTEEDSVARWEDGIPGEESAGLEA